MTEKANEMNEIAEELENFTQSPLYDYRVENDYHPVVGEGNPDADILFVGEAPGEKEAESGRPFVGASGRVLNELLETIDLDREHVYITNVVKDRPPDNRDPYVDEIELYAPFLRRQIELIQPRVIATLGRFAMEFMLDYFDVPHHGQKISELHGQPIGVQTDHGEVTLVPLYHPAVALYSRNRRGTLEEDFQVLQRYL